MDRSNSNVAGKQKPLKPNVDDRVLYFIFYFCDLSGVYKYNPSLFPSWSSPNPYFLARNM
jgi:hypothetical protein